MQFVYSTILLAGAAVAAPVIIHLIMRTKPRTITLPTLRFVKKSHKANLSKLRLKHLLLLLMRMGLIALLVLLLAKPYLPGMVRASAGEEPVAMAIVLDTSGSMTYRHQGRTLLERAKAIVSDIATSLPIGSRVTVVTTDGRGDTQGFLATAELSVRAAMDAPPGFGDAPLGPAVQRGLKLLADIQAPQKEMLILTDNTASAWRDFAPITAAESEGIRFLVVNVGVETDANISLGPVDVSSAQVPMGVGVTVGATVSSRNLGGELTIETDLDGQAVDRRSVQLDVGGQLTQSVPVVPNRQGVVPGRIQLMTPDALQADNTRYYTLLVGPPAEVLFVSTPAARDDQTSFLMEMAVAPPVAEGAGRLTRRGLTPDRLDEPALKDVPLVVLANAASLTDTQWRLLERYVRQGGRLWIVPGSMLSPDAYNTDAAQRVLPAVLRGQEQLPQPVRLGKVDTNQPMLKPFADPLNAPLTDREFARRLGVESLAEGSDVVLKYADGAPAIVTRALGAGRVLLWTFSPTPTWSNLARPGAQLIVLAGRTAEVLLAGEDRRTQYDWGQTAIVPVPANLGGVTATVRKPDQQSEQPVAVDLRLRVVEIVADSLGSYVLTFNDGDKTRTVGFSVNMPADQSDMAQVAPETLAPLLPGGQWSQIASAAGRTALRDDIRAPLYLLPGVILALLVLLTAETYFSNRFYRQPAPTGPDGGPKSP